MKTALITGITGQDGAYLSEFLLKKGYEVHGDYAVIDVDQDAETGLGTVDSLNAGACQAGLYKRARLWYT
jgi:GDP-D-mannose dehydratase